MKSPREIWTALQTQYENEKRGTAKFLTMNYFEYKIQDNKPIMDQVHDLQILISKMSELDVSVPNAIQVGAIFSKLPPSWSNYKKKIHHSIESFTFDQFKTHLQIEVESQSRDVAPFTNSNVNMVHTNNESGSKTQNNSNDPKKSKLFNKLKSLKKNMSCHHWGKKGYYIRE